MEPVKRRLGRSPFITVPLYHEDVLQSQPPDRLYDAVKARIDADEQSIAAFLESLTPWLYGPDMAAVPRLPAKAGEPFWDNGWFGKDDARALYAIIRQHTPRRLLEVGSGHSTLFACKAVEDGKTGTEIIAVDPVPRADVGTVPVRWIPKNVWEVEAGIFCDLEAGDVLFLDGSHLVMNGSDVVRFFLELLPLIRPGVLIHIHDIHLPYDYTSEFDGRGYGEQYMLATALLNSADLVVLLPVAYLAHSGRLREGGGSFWFMKRKWPLGLVGLPE